MYVIVQLRKAPHPKFASWPNQALKWPDANS